MCSDCINLSYCFSSICHRFPCTCSSARPLSRALQSARSAGVVRYGGGDGNPKRSQRSFSSKQMRRYSSPPRYRPPSNNNNHHNNNNGSERHHKKRRAYAPAPQR